MTYAGINYIINYMVKLVECIPNISEGRDKQVIEALAEAARSVPGAALLDYSSDVDHNRSVYTLLGNPEEVAEAAFRMCVIARDRIDMTKQTGAHPRIGAADVVPFVPMRGCGMDECVELSKKFAARIYSELSIPCFLYEESCTSENRRRLASIRKGEFEGLNRKLLLSEWAPDFGKREIHPTAGATAVGARQPLVAFNMNLDTADLAVAKTIAKKIRESGGGFRFCNAIGVMLASRGVAQVSVNMRNCYVTPLHSVFEAVEAEAGKYGASVTDSEIIGLAPARALIDGACYYMKLKNFDSTHQVLDNRLLEWGFGCLGQNPE